MFNTLAEAYMNNNSYIDALEALSNAEEVQEKYNIVISQSYRA